MLRFSIMQNISFATTNYNIYSEIDDVWPIFVEKKKIEELEKIIKNENLNHDETYKFIQNAFRDGVVSTTGTSITKVLPPISRFSQDNKRTKKRENVIEKLKRFFERFFNISNKKI